MHDAHDVMSLFDASTTRPAIERVGTSSFYAVRSWDLIVEATSRVADFSSNLTATMVVSPTGQVTEFPVAEPGSPVHALATADGEVHRSHRSLVSSVLSPRTLRAWRPFVDRRLRELWDEGCDAGRIDWVRSVAERLPAAVVAELMGLPAHDADRLCTWAFASTRMLDGVVSTDELDDTLRSVGELFDYLAAAVSGAKAAQDASVLGALARAMELGTISRDAAVHLLVQLVAAGIESTVGHLGSLVWRLGRCPDLLDRLRADPDLRVPFIEESLRTEAPFRGHYRHVTADTELGGTELPAGSHLFLLWSSANRDPQRFSDPDHFTPDRDEGSHVSFGRGIHFCPGAALARMESRAALDFLLDLDLDGRLEIDVSQTQWQQSLLVRRLRSLRLTVD